ncbi:recombinase family protein [Rhizobium sp. BE258]|uniref:recombinase family protein n=1 Tax=Rhizobium sp. BE258 TaxID=2817722 RepID=UPI00285DE7E2|nr:recombinase family protein [Rhizobium sp. BE258]MDR7145158.1 DNA invertase Pin-like site-specific DNA recombinase [Rhizobium sp. BE258]
MDQTRITSGSILLERPGTARTVAAVAYLRMSTDMQSGSFDNQMDIITSYADQNGFELVRLYRDEGKSGLSLHGRTALKRLLEDAAVGSFKAILVCDVSRWGRFQDPDEAAEIELRCKRLGIAVHYCGEQFENDGTVGSAIIKTVKRVMAGEFSRELSAKVWRGQASLVRKGFHQGGPPGYGLRRQLIDSQGKPVAILSRGQQKSIITDRIILVRGPDDEVATVNRIFTLFAEAQLSERQIASILNAEGLLAQAGTAWTSAVVARLLSNEKYIGNSVWAKTSTKLGQPRRMVPSPEWVRYEAAFDAIVPHQLFEKARARLAQRSPSAKQTRILEQLKTLFEKYGRLSADIINASADCPSSATYIYQFGALRNAYERIGYDPGRDYRFVDLRQRLRRLDKDLLCSIQTELETQGQSFERHGRTFDIHG